MYANVRINVKLILVMSIMGTTCLAVSHDLVDIQSINPSIKLDIRYATTNNFTKQKVYRSAKCYLRRQVAEALSRVQCELEEQGLGLKVWDGYRPLQAQWVLWEIVPDPRYVSDPRKGGRHTRGTAVDVTIVRISDGKEVAMPTGFDDFTEKAWRSYNNLSEEVKKNRQLLQTVMTKPGFVGLETEWWHFDWHDWKNFDVLDISFEDLA